LTKRIKLAHEMLTCKFAYITVDTGNILLLNSEFLT